MQPAVISHLSTELPLVPLDVVAPELIERHFAAGPPFFPALEALRPTDVALELDGETPQKMNLTRQEHSTKKTEAVLESGG